MPQVCFTSDEELIEQIEQLAKKWRRSRSATIELLLKAAVPVSLGKRPLHEGREATVHDLKIMILELQRRVERLEEKIKEVR